MCIIYIYSEMPHFSSCIVQLGKTRQQYGKWGLAEGIVGRWEVVKYSTLG